MYAGGDVLGHQSRQFKWTHMLSPPFFLDFLDLISPGDIIIRRVK
jgi:hypothetical protein